MSPAQNAVQYREMPAEELESVLKQARDEMFKLRVQQSLGQLEKPSRIRDVRRQIARILTVRQEKQAAAQAKA
jgi:large subunit ribosomal protein L29